MEYCNNGICNNQNRKGKILLVDDELDVTFSLKICLEENGFEVDIFNKSSSVLRNFKSGVYDLIILDIKMPEINGIELYEKIREIDNNVCILFLTALSDFSVYRRELKASSLILNEKNLVQKPVDNRQLLKTVTTMIGD